VHARGVTTGLEGVEAGELLEVDEGAAVDSLEDAGGEAVLEVLEGEVGEQGAAAGVEGDELAVEEGVGELAGSSRRMPWRVVMGRRRSSAAGAWVWGPRRWRARARALPRRTASIGLSR
jgi:hypothetical protein